jgi:hypothetical protein
MKTISNTPDLEERTMNAVLKSLVTSIAAMMLALAPLSSVHAGPFGLPPVHLPSTPHVDFRPPTLPVTHFKLPPLGPTNLRPVPINGVEKAVEQFGHGNFGHRSFNIPHPHVNVQVPHVQNPVNRWHFEKHDPHLENRIPQNVRPTTGGSSNSGSGGGNASGGSGQTQVGGFGAANVILYPKR